MNICIMSGGLGMEAQRKRSLTLYIVLFMLVICSFFVIYLKSSGFDLAKISVSGFAALSKMEGRPEKYEFPYSSNGHPFFCVYNNSIAVAKKDGLKCYSKSGQELWGYEGTFNKPVLKVSGDMLLLFDIKGRSLAVFDKGSLKWELNRDSGIMKGDIINADINKEGYVCLVLRDDYYRNSVVLLSPKGEWICTRNIAEDFTISASVSPDSSQILLNNLNTSGIKSKTNLVFTNMRVMPFSSITLDDTLIVYAGFMDNGSLVAISKSGVFCYDKDRKEKWKLNFSDKNIVAAGSGSDRYIALVMKAKSNIFSPEEKELLVVNLDGRTLSSTKINDEVKNLDVHGDRIAVNTGKELFVYSARGRLLGKISYGKDILNAEFLNSFEIAAITRDSVIVAPIGN